MGEAASNTNCSKTVDGGKSYGSYLGLVSPLRTAEQNYKKQVLVAMSHFGQAFLAAALLLLWLRLLSYGFSNRHLRSSYFLRLILDRFRYGRDSLLGSLLPFCSRLSLFIFAFLRSLIVLLTTFFLVVKILDSLKNLCLIIFRAALILCLLLLSFLTAAPTLNAGGY